MTAKQKKFITSLEVTGDIEKACKSTGITKRTFYNWCKSNEEFRVKTELKEPTNNIVKVDLKSDFLRAYKENFNISSSCEEVGISRGTFYNWVKNDEEFKFNVGSVNEGVIDLAESVITKAMTETNQEGNPTKKAVDTAKFILSQRGIKRGWGEKIQAEIIMTPYEKAQDAKRQAKEIVLDVTPEQLQQKVNQMKEEFKKHIETDEEKREAESEAIEKEKAFRGELTPFELIEYERDQGEFIKKRVLERLRDN